MDLIQLRRSLTTVKESQHLIIVFSYTLVNVPFPVCTINVYYGDEPDPEANTAEQSISFWNASDDIAY
jgi:hypothetical protein